MREDTSIYTIVETGIDVDHSSFPDPEAIASFLSCAEAEAELDRLIAERKKDLRPRLNQENRDRLFWEASEEGYEISNFMRLEILTSKLKDGGVRE
ncbi:MAG: hypothetical protein IJT94_05780 [Oscillibacter sp.]|nr:hypothetical protein [Oscillibacter sp.]